MEYWRNQPGPSSTINVFDVAPRLQTGKTEPSWERIRSRTGLSQDGYVKCALPFKREASYCRNGSAGQRCRSTQDFVTKTRRFPFWARR